MRQNKTLRSSLATYIDAFLQEKYACGYRYTIETAMLRRFDKFLYKNDCPDQQLPRTLIEKWMSKQPHESPANHKLRQRIINQFARYLCQYGLKAHVVNAKLAPAVRFDFVPYIFTREQIGCLFQMADRLPYDLRSPVRHLIIPEVFRLLYGCGLRISEALQLRIKDVYLD
jgi:integrase/recombinase XerD